MGEDRPAWRPSAVAVAAFAAGLALLAVLSLAASRWERFPGDLELARAVQSVNLPGLDALAQAAHHLVDLPVALATLTVFILLFLVLRRILEAALVAATVAPAFFMEGLKRLVARPRPGDDLVPLAHPYSSGSFPSGHVVYWTVVYGLLFALMPALLPQRRWQRLARGALLSVILFGGFSRVYLGDHWPSDVLGGYLFGLLALLALLAVYRLLRELIQRQREGRSR